MRITESRSIQSSLCCLIGSLIASMPDMGLDPSQSGGCLPLLDGLTDGTNQHKGGCIQGWLSSTESRVGCTDCCLGVTVDGECTVRGSELHC